MKGRITVVLPLREAVLAREARTAEVTVIRPGLSKNGNYYAPGLLAALVPLFEGARAFADHPAAGDRPERSVRDLVGYYTAPRQVDGGAIRAVLHVSKNADWLWTLIAEAVEGSQPDLIGLSINALGKASPGTHNGRQCRVVESFDALESCDVVTRASAGGRFERVLEADNQSWWDDFAPANEQGAALQDAFAATGASIERLQVPASGGRDGGAGTEPVQVGPTIAANIPGGRVIASATYLAEGQRPMGDEGQGQTQTGAVAAPAVQAAEATLLEVQRAREEAAQLRKLLEAERVLARALPSCGLPAPVVRRLDARFSGRVFEASELDAAIADERSLLAELTDSGLIRGMGYEKRIAVGMSETERLQKAFDQLFDIQEGERVPALSGLREAYAIVTGDPGVTGVTAPERLREADVTTASFSYLLGTSMNKRLLKDYQAWPSEWQKFCTVTPIKDFKQQDRIRLGAFGSLSTVAEDAAYTTLTLSDTRATYAPTKRGNLVAVTRETVVNDDLYAIKQIPGKLAVAAAMTLAEFVYGFLTATANIYDGSPLFQKNAGHTNSAVATPGTPNTGVALASAAMQTGVTAMRRQTNMAGKPIGLKPRFLIVPPELEWAAMVITKSAGAPGSNANDINPMLGYAEVLVAPQLSSATYWALAADPRVIDTIEIGFVGGQLNPVLFVQDQPLFGNNFTNDVITYKVRHEYGGAVVDYRGFYQGNN